ncbi:GntR family transcriptional regulator [Amycolatopsis sp. lyj-90]|uniref:GntR family transcriptional regulator n=1 Tax=Amycolatopsis sp. lyj-90 TaxID=2789285 RepID=UPI00397BE490
MTRTEGGGTRADEVFDAIRAAILYGVLAPGERLKFDDLRERFSCSVSAARESLTRLSAQGLVSVEPHVGFSVVQLSVGALVELTEARVEIETLALRLSIERGNLAWEQRVVSSCHLLSRIPLGEPDAKGVPQLSEPWAAAHADFHHALLEGCGNSRLLEVASQLRDSAELYRRWSVWMGDEPHRDVAAEHSELRDQALDRDTDAAVAALRRHITHTTDLLLSGARTSEERTTAS